jgi:LPPG:FO 2-phospho-L-lactate transferase
VYTVAGIEGPHGWGRGGETFRVMTELDRLPGADTSFRLGDLDLAVNLYRSGRLHAGEPLSQITGDIARGLGVGIRIMPVTDDRLRTRVVTPHTELDFQTYFVRRRHTDTVTDIRFDGADAARPAPGVIEAIDNADLVLIAPSNPILSIWPILAVPGVAGALTEKQVVAVSPLIDGKALKGPAVEVMRALGYGPTNQGVCDTYDGLLTGLVINTGDAHPRGPAVLATDTRIEDAGAARRLTEEIVAWVR